jgi:hypothetical protein
MLVAFTGLRGRNGSGDSGCPAYELQWASLLAAGGSIVPGMSLPIGDVGTGNYLMTMARGF